MRYEVFDESVIKKDPAYRTQEHMERTYREVTRPSAEERISLNDSLSPEFLSCSWADKTLRFKFKNRPWMQNTGGNIHGGMLASVCDMAMGILARYMKGSADCVTVSLGVDYMRKVPADVDLLVESRVEKAGRNVYFMSARVYRMSDLKLAVTANATFM